MAGLLCEKVGATVLFGKKFLSQDIDEASWARCAQTGFDILRKGEDGFRDFLIELHSDFWSGKNEVGGRNHYGRLYEWLAYETDDPAFDPVRTLVRDVALTSLPFAPGDQMFEPVTERRFHTIRSTSVQYGLHPYTVRKMVIDAELLDESAATDHRVLMPAAAVDELMTKVASSLSWLDARTYLNCTRQLWNTITHEGYLAPIFNPLAKSGISPLYAQSDLDQFLALLRTFVTVDSRANFSLYPVAIVRRRANCKFSEILDALLEGRLETVGWDAGVKGIDALLFDEREIATVTKLPPHDGISLRVASKTLAINDTALAKLVASGVIRSERATNPINRCPQTVIRPEEIERFQATYMSLHHYNRLKRENMGSLKKRLAAAGVFPAYDEDAVGMTLYRRTELPQ